MKISKNILTTQLNNKLLLNQWGDNEKIKRR